MANPQRRVPSDRTRSTMSSRGYTLWREIERAVGGPASQVHVFPRYLDIAVTNNSDGQVATVTVNGTTVTFSYNTDLTIAAMVSGPVQHDHTYDGTKLSDTTQVDAT